MALAVGATAHGAIINAVVTSHASVGGTPVNTASLSGAATASLSSTPDTQNAATASFSGSISATTIHAETFAQVQTTHAGSDGTADALLDISFQVDWPSTFSLTTGTLSSSRGLLPPPISTPLSTPTSTPTAPASEVYNGITSFVIQSQLQTSTGSPLAGNVYQATGTPGDPVFATENHPSQTKGLLFPGHTYHMTVNASAYADHGTALESQLVGTTSTVNVDLNIANFDLVMGDFNFDGGFDGSDIDGLVASILEGMPFTNFIANNQAAFQLLYPGLGLTLNEDVMNFLGDANGDGGYDGSDIDDFFIIILGGRPALTTAIPEPSAIALVCLLPLSLSKRPRR